MPDPSNTYTDKYDASEQVTTQFIRYLPSVIFGWEDPITPGNGKFYYDIVGQMGGGRLVYCKAKLITAGVGSTMLIQIHNLTQAVDMLATRLMVNSGSLDSSDAATPYDIDEDNDDLADNDTLRVDIDQNHSTPGQGLILTLGIIERNE